MARITLAIQSFLLTLRKNVNSFRKIVTLALTDIL